MIFEIYPYIGIGKLCFGMTRDEVRRLISHEFCSFRRGKEGSPIDHFTKIGLLANYDDGDRLEFVEFAEPAEPTLFGVNLLGLSANAAKAFLGMTGGDLKEDLDGAASRNLGVELWILPDPEEPELPAESVLVASREYYERHNL